MAVVKARNQDINMLARLLRAEAEAEGEMGMLLVGMSALTEYDRIAPTLKKFGPFPK